MIKWTVKMFRRFRVKVAVAGVDDCWHWLAAKDRDGYGIFHADRKVPAHRAIYELSAGLEADEVVMHECDTPSCVNPKHLKSGTQRENIQDCIAKGRRNYACGTRARASRLTEGDVHAIRRRLDRGHLHRVIGEDFGVHRATISDLSRGDTWGHLEHEPPEQDGQDFLDHQPGVGE